MYLQQQGVDSTYMAEFLKGVTDGANKTSPKDVAYMVGLQVGQQVGGRMFDMMSQRFFVQLGNISYSLYLVHYYPVMFLDRVVFDFSTLSVLSVVGLIVSVVISIVLAYLCWILIERKFTGWLRRILLR